MDENIPPYLQCPHPHSVRKNFRLRCHNVRCPNRHPDRDFDNNTFDHSLCFDCAQEGAFCSAPNKLRHSDGHNPGFLWQEVLEWWCPACAPKFANQQCPTCAEVVCPRDIRHQCRACGRIDTCVKCDQKYRGTHRDISKTDQDR